MRKFLVLCMTVVLVMAFSTGCSNVQRGIVAGGLIGAAVGGPWAHNSSSMSTAGGIAIGAAAGGLGGAFIGDLFDQKKARQERAEFEAKLADLQNQLKAKDDYIKELKAEIEDLKSRPRVEYERIEISNAVLFASGKAQLTDEGKATLKKVAEYIKGRYPDKRVVIEGHTDSQPIRYSNWKSNWELGAARALSVLHYVGEWLPQKELSAQTFGEFNPKADNATAEGRQMNRRSVLVIVDKLPTRTVEAN